VSKENFKQVSYSTKKKCSRNPHFHYNIAEMKEEKSSSPKTPTSKYDLLSKNLKEDHTEEVEENEFVCKKPIYKSKSRHNLNFNEKILFNENHPKPKRGAEPKFLSHKTKFNDLLKTNIDRLVISEEYA
jgi:hypothetical protein